MREFDHVTKPVPVDIDGAWWCGFYQGWRDRADGMEDATLTDDAALWSVGYRDGWRSCACDGAVGRDRPIWGTASGRPCHRRGHGMPRQRPA